MIAWYWLVHVAGIDYGLPFGRWSWYNFWSGIGGSFLIGSLVWLFGWYAHNTCHDSKWCLRWGKYPAAGGTFKVCHRHHPDMGGQRPHRELIARLHAEHRECR